MSDTHWENVAELANYGESSGTGPWIQVLMPVRDMPIWRGLKGSVYVITACVVDEINGQYELNKEFVWRNDGQQLGFGETDTKGGWVKFRVEPEDLAFFRGRKDDYFYWKFILSEKVEKIEKKKAKAKKEKGNYGSEVRDLHQSGFFKNPKLWKIIGTDQQYQEFTRKRRCIVTGGYDWDEAKGVERTEFAHVRRAGDSGTAHKPEFSGVPLVHEIHRLQHNGGEAAAYDKYLVRRGIDSGGVVTETAAKEWFEKKALENVEKWAHEALLNKLNLWLKSFNEPPVDSLTKIPPKVLRGWAHSVQIQNFLPKCYKEAE